MQAQLCDLIPAYELSRRPGASQTRALAAVSRHFGRMRPDAITPATVQAYRKRRGCTDSTVRRELGALVAVLNWAAKTRSIPRESVPHIDLPPPGQARDLFMDEIDAWGFHDAAVAKGPRIGAFVSLALNTGARKEAILRLSWDRVDLVAGTVDYREPGRAVSKKRRVAVPINPTLAKVLWELPREGRLVVGAGSLRHTYESFADGLGMGWVTPHVLRHTAATLMLRAGVSVWDVAGVLGDTVETVTRVYGHHSTTHLRGAVGALGRAPCQA